MTQQSFRNVLRPERDDREFPHKSGLPPTGAISSHGDHGADSREILETIPVFIYLLARDYTFSYVNSCFRQEFGIPDRFTRCHSILRKCHEPCDPCPAMRVFADGRERTWLWRDSLRGNIYEIRDIPFGSAGETALVLGVGYNLTRRLQEVGRHPWQRDPDKFVKICCHCRKIHNRKGEWQNMEPYFTEEQKFRFSHCICPDCMQQHYADLVRGVA